MCGTFVDDLWEHGHLARQQPGMALLTIPLPQWPTYAAFAIVELVPQLIQLYRLHFPKMAANSCLDAFNLYSWLILLMALIEGGVLQILAQVPHVLV